MKREPLTFQLQQYAFGLALVAMVAAMVFSILRRTHIAEQAGIGSYIFLVIGVISAFVNEMRTKPSDRAQNISPNSRRTHSRKRSV